MPERQRKRALLVVGMHRSGTSATSRVLNLLGADLPREVLPGNAEDNPTGYWESPDLVKIHDEMLASGGSSWDDVSLFPESWFVSDKESFYQDEVARFLDSNFKDSPLFIVEALDATPTWRDQAERRPDPGMPAFLCGHDRHRAKASLKLGPVGA